ATSVPLVPEAFLKAFRPATFDGKLRDSRAEDWLMSFQRYCTFLNITDQNMAANCLALLLTGDASRWFEIVRDTIDPNNPFEDLKAKFRARFIQSHDADDAFDQLRTLRQTGSAFDYTFKFQRLALRVKNLDAHTACRLLKGGLKPETRQFVENHPSALDHDLNALISLIERVDRSPYTASRHSQNKHRSDPYQPQYMELDSVRVQPHGSSQSRFQGPPRNKQQQKQYDFEHNLCLYCHKPGHRVANCPKKSGKARA
ncbi:hypothetical protein BGW42_008182, partial [Actinomortierella wolfii]